MQCNSFAKVNVFFFTSYLTHQEAQFESPLAVVLVAYPIKLAGYADKVKGERTVSPLLAQIPHIGQYQ